MITIALPRGPKTRVQVELGLAGAGRQEAELRRDDDLPARFSEVASDRRLLLNAKGGLSARHTHQIQQFLKENFLRKLSLAEMAAVCDLSPYHFARAFSKTFGVSPYQCVLLLRLDLAEKLLAESSMPITDIADLSGFSSQSHFTTMLKKYRRVTPQQVRTNRRSPQPEK